MSNSKAIKRIEPHETPDSPELQVQDIMRFGVFITRDGKRVDPLDFYPTLPEQSR